MTTLVVFSHPVPECYGAAVMARATAALTEAGAEPRLLDLYAEGFSAVDADAAVVDAHRDALHTADALVLVYPTWWSGLPAMLNGWLHQVVGGDDPDLARTLLANLRYVAVVTTHGSSKLVNAAQGEAGLHFLRGALRPLLPRRCRLHWLPLYSADRSTRQDREAFLTKTAHRLHHLATNAPTAAG